MRSREEEEKKKKNSNRAYPLVTIRHPFEKKKKKKRGKTIPDRDLKQIRRNNLHTRLHKPGAALERRKKKRNSIYIIIYKQVRQSRNGSIHTIKRSAHWSIVKFQVIPSKGNSWQSSTIINARPTINHANTKTTMPLGAIVLSSSPKSR